MKLLYLASMIIVVNLIRVLPVTLIRRKISNQFLRSFLYYVPYVTLAVMTFPAIIDATENPFSGLLALILGIISAWCGFGLFPVALICSAVVFITELFIL